MAAEAEHTIRELACQVLDREDIGPDEDLFDLGADSLDIIELVATLEVQLGIKVNVRTVMRNPTVRSLALACKEDGSS
ncbi:MAG: acyl carrier protein [Mycobacterium sp.]